MPDRVIDAPLILPPADGEECATLLLETLRQHEGVRSAQIDFDRGMLHLHYDPDLIDFDTVDGIATDLGLRLGARMRHCTLELEGVSCRNCAFNLEQELAAIPGVHRITANPAARVVGVRYGDDMALAQIEKRIAELGYEVRERRPETKPPSFWQRNIGLIWAGLTLLFLLTGIVLERLTVAAAYPWLPILFFGLAYVAGGHDGLREAVRDLRHGVLNVDFLMISSAVGAAIIGEWAEGATLLFLFTLSGALEAYAMDRTRNAIQALTAYAVNVA